MDPVAEAAKIEGWMTLPELEWLSRTASSRRIIIEIGSWKGRSTKVMALSTPGKVYAIDHWMGSPSETGKEHAEAARIGPEAMYGIFSKNLETEISIGRVIPIREDCLEALPILGWLLERHPADMIFIDGDHSYEAVKRDILAYRRFLAPEGILSGHDYEEGGPGVIRAVNELVPGFERGPGSIWFKCAS